MQPRNYIELAPFTPPWYPTVLASACFLGERYTDVIDVVEPLVSDVTAGAEAMLLLTASQQALDMRRNACAALAEARVPVSPAVDSGSGARSPVHGRLGELVGVHRTDRCMKGRGLHADVDR